MKLQKRDETAERVLSSAVLSIEESKRILDRMKAVREERKRAMDQIRKDLYDGKKPN